jgi:hypothetical protein
VNLQAVSLAKAAAPSTDVPAATSGRSNAAKPAARPFNHVLGSLMSDEVKPPARANLKKQVTNQDSPTGQQQDATVPPAKPIVLPALLKFSLLLPASSKAVADESDERDGSDGDASSTNQLTQIAALQVIPQPAVPTPQPTNANPQPGGQVAQGTSRLEMPAGELLHSLRSQTPLEPFNPSDADKQRLAVDTENGQPLPKAELALSVKLTPAANAVPKSTNAPSMNPAPRVNATPSAASPEPMSAGATGADQQADTSADSDSGQASKLVLKSQSKTQQTVTSPNAEPGPTVSNQYPGQATQVTGPATITTAPSVEQPPTKHENDPTTQPVDARPNVAALPDAAAASKVEPIRDLSIRIGNTAGNQVDVKIQERAGEVHVSVLSSNSALTSDLRQQVGDLVGKLDRAGYHAETFKPTSSAASPQSPSQSDSGQERDSSGGRQQQQQQQETARQQFMGRQKRSNQAQWLQQMNGSFGQGATEGIERQ